MAISDGSSKIVDCKVVSGFQFCLEKFFSGIPSNVKNAGFGKIKECQKHRF